MGGPGVGSRVIHLKVELDREDDGRWIAEVADIPGVIVYGATEQEALKAAQSLALHVIAERLTRGDDPLTGLRRGEATHATTTVERIEFEPALAV
jgi:predicted RNase H-like HicB family nuclease